MEERYGDDRSISAEEFDKKCDAIIDKYGLGDKKFTDDEMCDPSEDQVDANRHPQVRPGSCCPPRHPHTF